MPTTRSGIIYNSNRIAPTIESSKDSHVRKSPRGSHSTLFEKLDREAYPKRSNRTAFPQELIRDYCDDSDNDSTSDYGSYDGEYMKPRYEVNIDFDEASAAWRANKRRVGESWVYKLNPKHPENIKTEIIDEAIASVTSHIAAKTTSNSVASRVKQRHSSRLSNI